jgi:hypothetical protein
MAIIELSFNYQKNKVMQALRYHFLSRKEIRFLVVAVNVFAILSAALFYWKKILPLAFLSSSLLWFILMLTIWYILPLTVYTKNKTFKDAFDIRFLEDGLLIANPGGSKSWSYASFQYFMETANFFHLYLNEKSFFLLPKDALSDSDQIHQLRLLLREKMGNRSEKK